MQGNELRATPAGDWFRFRPRVVARIDADEAINLTSKRAQGSLSELLKKRKSE
jgi:hypothetical protein